MVETTFSNAFRRVGLVALVAVLLAPAAIARASRSREYLDARIDSGRGTFLWNHRHDGSCRASGARLGAALGLSLGSHEWGPCVSESWPRPADSRAASDGEECGGFGLSSFPRRSFGPQVSGADGGHQGRGSCPAPMHRRRCCSRGRTFGSAAALVCGPTVLGAELAARVPRGPAVVNLHSEGGMAEGACHGRMCPRYEGEHRGAAALACGAVCLADHHGKERL